MTPIDLDTGLRSALQSIRENRLAVIVGAGLSIPSGIRSAWELAQEAKRRYDLARDPGEDPLSEDIEEQADFFYRSNRLTTYYIPRLIDKHAFAGAPNDGHTAVADFLLTGAARVAVSTNYDELIEAAGLSLDGMIDYALDGVEAANIDGAPLLKIHGCWRRDKLHTVWTPSQVGDGGEVDQRLTSSANWLAGHLANVDLLVIGFWSDWSYLNAVIAQSLGALNPSSVTSVDPAPRERLQEKAPGLHAIGTQVESFQHVRASGKVFLDRLREQFSKSYIRHILRAGAATYQAQSGAPPEDAWVEPPFAGNDVLWQVRRDLEGRFPNEPAQDREPEDGDALGLAMIELQAAGAVPEGASWRLPQDILVRVLNGKNRTTHVMKGAYDSKMSSPGPDVVVAVGAVDSPLVANVGRPNEGGSTHLAPPAPSIVRPAPRRWETQVTDILAPLP